MCGIVGLAGPDHDRRRFVERSTPWLHHRGPDARGVRHYGGCSLGHTRLRILDLSPSGDQPLTNADATVAVSYNGEIYNHRELRSRLEAAGHRFHSLTDTEILVHLYEDEGERLVDRLRGMFAFAIWDDRRQRLLLVRDRLGIKPLYYRVRNGSLSFASEANTLADGTQAIDIESLAAYLRLGWVPGPRTIWEGIAEVPAGHVLIWERGVSTLRPYWSPPATSSRATAPDSDELSEALVDAVRRHLVADVPVGLFLSSGVDSAVLGCLAKQVAPGTRAFTVVGDWMDESVAAGALARLIGLDHTTVRVEDNAVHGDIDRFFGAMDQPTVDGLNTWVISSAVRKAGLVVALSGLGGDELFNGYSTFRHVPRLASAGRVARFVPRGGADVVDRAFALAGATAHSRARRAAEAVTTGGWANSYAAVRGLFGSSELERLWPQARASRPISGVQVPFRAGERPESVVGRLEVANYLPFQLLRDTDVMSMAHALEVRVPLLDDELVQLTFERRILADRAWSKTDLALAASPQLVGTAARPKRTFTLPIDQWMRGRLRNEALGALVELGEADQGFDRRELSALWSGFEARQVGWRPVWALVVLSRWLGARAAR